MPAPASLALLLALLGGRPAAEPQAAPQAAGETGMATYYAGRFHGRRTASGTRFDSTMMLAAHPTLPFGTTVRVHDLSSGRSVVVCVVDRGPARAPQKAGVIIDLSRAAADYLHFGDAGRHRVRLEVLEYVAPVLPGAHLG